MEYKVFIAGNVQTEVFRVKIETTGFSDMPIFIYKTTWRHIRKDSLEF
jgi:hypothetical protein